MPSQHEQRDALAPRFVAALGATMAAANYPVTMVRAVVEQTSRAYGLDHHFLALPNSVQAGSPTGEGIHLANPDFDVRYDQSFPLAQLVARAPTGSIIPEEGVAGLGRIRNQRRRFPSWVSTLGYGEQSAGRPSTHHMVSGASRLVTGFMQIAQLAFCILIAARVAGVADDRVRRPMGRRRRARKLRRRVRRRHPQQRRLHCHTDLWRVDPIDIVTEQAGHA